MTQPMMNTTIKVPITLLADINAIVADADLNVRKFIAQEGRTQLERIDNLLAFGIIVYRADSNSYAMTNMGLLFKTSREVNWIEITNYSEVPDNLEMIFHTRYCKTIIGVRIGNQVHCGNQNIPLEEITHYRKQLEKPQ